MQEYAQPPKLLLSLLGRDGEVPAKSGLNWWNASGRVRRPDEAYIALPSASLEQAEIVFGSAKKGTTFLAKFHDGTEMEMLLEGEQGADKTKAKQISSKGDKTLLGQWMLRTVLGIPYGEMVTRADLDAHGRTDVTFTRVGEDPLTGDAIVEMDFAPRWASDYPPEVERMVTSDLAAVYEEEAAYEGQVHERFTNYYERDAHLRAQAIVLHGTTCKGCGFDFEALYGERGRDYIEVHHLRPVSALGGATLTDPRTDMTVLCANCHRMVHRDHDHVLGLDELQAVIGGRRVIITDPE